MEEIESFIESELNERQNHEKVIETNIEVTVIEDNITKLFELAGVNFDGESDGGNSARSNDQLDQSRKSESFEQTNSINRSVTRKRWNDPSRTRYDLEVGQGLLDGSPYKTQNQNNLFDEEAELADEKKNEIKNLLASISGVREQLDKVQIIKRPSPMRKSWQDPSRL